MKHTRHALKAFQLLGLAIFLSLSLLVSPLSAQDSAAVDSLREKAWDAYSRGDEEAELYYWSAYVDREPQYLVDNPLIASWIKTRLRHLIIRTRSGRMLLTGQVPSGVSNGIANRITVLINKGCPSVQKPVHPSTSIAERLTGPGVMEEFPDGDEISDLEGTVCGPGVKDREDPLIALLEADPLVLEGMLRYLEDYGQVVSNGFSMPNTGQEWPPLTTFQSGNSGGYIAPNGWLAPNALLSPFGWTAPNVYVSPYGWWPGVPYPTISLFGVPNVSSMTTNEPHDETD
jgi:hypothetical protein